MNLPYEIRTIDEINEVTAVVNKSNFIAQVYPVFSESDAKEYVIKAKKRYYDASHHCYAFKLADGTVRYSDAGEPNGTAGIRIQNAIEHFKLSNQLIIVSRIFGGIKLGVGPLGKAYYQSAYQVINDSKISTKQLFQKATVSAIYDQISFIHRILSNHNSIVEDSEYKESIKLTCLLKSSEIELISKKISDLGKNKITITFHKETVYK
ncbi:MAG: YigZ family protein [Ignavibacteria bacterium]|nr:YigZ family protein [Ignavibacteria bacterium]